MGDGERRRDPGHRVICVHVVRRRLLSRQPCATSVRTCSLRSSTTPRVPGSRVLSGLGLLSPMIATAAMTSSSVSVIGRNALEVAASSGRKMFDGHGFGFAVGFYGLFWILLIVAIARAVKATAFTGPEEWRGGQVTLEILVDRLARGEIDEKEFERKRKLLGR